MRLTWAIGIATFLVLLLSLSLLALLGLHKFERQLQAVTAARVQVTATDARRAIENALALGLPLADVQGVQAIVDRAAAADAQIAAIAVIDLELEPGRLLFSAGGSAEFHLPPAGPQQRAHDGEWRWTSQHGNPVAGWILTDPLRRSVGLLAIETRRGEQERLVAEAGSRLVRAAAILAAFMLAAVLVVVGRIVAPFEHTIARARAIVAGSAPAGDAAPDSITALATDFQRATAAAERRITAAPDAPSRA